MALQQIRVCDITGDKEGVEVQEFEVDDRKYRIDLNPGEQEKLSGLLKQAHEIREALQVYVEKAEDTTPGQPTLPGKAAKKDTGPDAADVRRWAKSTSHRINGEPIPERGRVPQAWKDAYSVSRQRAALERGIPHLASDSGGQEAGEPSAAPAPVEETEQAAASQ
ncbi:Lsr2 dimerization domain-containing protein [Streptomyces griseus]|uniref:Lsr2 dimerization domain-containing protein n=1 Tax=Streptomyces griseus TaxID=1911 RepID=UPI00379C984A